MKKITCTRPNASEEISGVKFEKVGDAMVSGPVADDVAARFDGIPGYEIVDVEAEAKPLTKAEAKAKAEADAKAAADAEAAAAKKTEGDK